MSLIEISQKSKIGIVTLNNPPFNISTKELKDELYSAINQFEKNSDISLIIISAQGEKAFSVGSDVNELKGAIENKSVKERAKHENALNNYIENLTKPTIAAINGLVLGGGLELALACDMRICSKDTRLGVPEIKLGLFPGGGGSERLPKLIGYSKALELMLTGDLLDAKEALRIGLVNRISVDNVVTDAIKFAEKISGYSLETITRIKKITKRGLNLPFEEANRRTILDSVEVFHSKHGQEGINAFLEKRTPNFSE